MVNKNFTEIDCNSNIFSNFAPLFVEAFGEVKTFTINIFRTFREPH